MLIPEIILYNTLKAFKQVVANDYNNATDKSQTILNDLFGVDNNNIPLQYENFNYLEQAIAVLARTDEHVRKFQVSIGYNLQRAFLPTVHILLPQESPGRYDSIGFGEGEIAPQFNLTSLPQSEIDTRIKSSTATFDLMITSDNTSEVLLLYYFIKAMLLYVGDTFELLGLHNFKTTGMDIQLDDRTAPTNIFHRTLRTEFDYQSEVKIRNIKQFSGILNLTICSNIGFDYANRENPNSTPDPRQQVSDNIEINITKLNQTGNVGYIRLTNKVTGLIGAPIVINLTNQPNNFQLATALTPGNYKVEFNIINLIGDINGDIGDGLNPIAEIDSAGQFTYYTNIDVKDVKSENIIINLNFS